MYNEANVHSLIRRARLRLMAMHHGAGVGHVGGSLSCIDSLIVLHHCILDSNDKFILSKGHAATALYIALWSTGRLSDDDLATYAQDNTLLGIHPPVSGLDSVPFGTGSLGHGTSLAAGLALGMRLKQNVGRVFCMTSDGEWQEGSCWEALIFAVHQKLDKLIILIDLNGLQAFGTTKEVASMGNMEQRFRSFGAEVIICDGHDPSKLYESLSHNARLGVPKILILRTQKGNGLPFFENRVESHYLPLSDEQYKQAVSLFSEEEK